MAEMDIWIGCDHGGYQMKKVLMAEMDIRGVTYHDVGCPSTEIVRYPYFAALVSQAVANNKARGILICSTGIGMSIIANKYKGVRAALCLTEYMAEKTREHNDSNILCMGGQITDEELAKKILSTWLSTKYIGGRHDISLGLIREAEQQMLNTNYWI